MMEDRDESQGGSSKDPEERAFTGAADMPPQQPDQPAQENQELLRDRQKAEEPSNEEPGKPNPHGEYTNLPGYGG